MKPVVGPHVWRGPELAARSDWIVPIPASALDELDAASRRSPSEFGTADYPALRALGGQVRHALDSGYGFILLKGVPVGHYRLDHLKTMLLAFGDQTGLVAAQFGERQIGEVMDHDTPGKKEFYFHIGGPLPMHMDPVDVVALLCVRKAKSGGESGIVSAMMVHNEILRTRPDLLKLLYRGVPNLRRNDRDPHGRRMLTDHHCPIFADIGGQTVCSFLPSPIELAVEEGLLTLTPDELDALRCLAQTAARNDLVLHMDLEPGDIQILNNRVILHNRSDYEDHAEMDRRRLLLRLWMTIPGWRKFPPTIPRVDQDLGTLAS